MIVLLILIHLDDAGALSVGYRYVKVQSMTGSRERLIGVSATGAVGSVNVFGNHNALFFLLSRLVLLLSRRRWRKGLWFSNFIHRKAVPVALRQMK